MGLMDIGQNNPYARINPLAAMIEQGMSGWNTERDRYQKLQNERLNQQQQAALLEMKQQEADRLNEQDILNSKAQQALQERRGTYQRGLMATTAPEQDSLMALAGNNQYGVGLQLPDRVFSDNQMAGMEQKAKTAPWSQQELASFAMQYPGTTAAKEALSVAPLVKPDKTSMQMLVENVLKDPTKYDKRTLAIVSQLTGVGVGAKGDAPKYSVEERYDDKTHTTYGRDFFWNNGKKEYVGDERPIKGRESTKVLVNNTGGLGKQDQYEMRAAATQLPKLYDNAQASQSALGRIGTMRSLVAKGDVGGVTNYLKGVLSPYVPNVKSMSNAEVYQQYAIALSGPHRQAIIGTGPQTEPEGKLLREFGSAGLKSKDAVLGLLDLHEKMNMDNINNYNRISNAYGGRIYTPIEVKQREGSAPKAANPTMNSLPDATQHKGRVVLGSDGIKRVSDGSKWVIKR